MNAPRQRRPMTADDMIEFMPATVEQMDADEFDLQGVISGLPEKYFHRGVDEGWCVVTNIRHNGQTKYRLYWQKRALGEHCHVMASLFVGSGNNDPDVWSAAAEMVARAAGCKKITFETKRRGHVEQALSWGATVTGVLMEKNL